ncbi:zinc ABC transporter substrate-binding protein ZnuA [Enterovibrio paralichthyis]|uniref:zinc ABC transporter substrate-binding protein ZnuA n=1 Tax=Enterovibrio paralichthyis TaxID=2853805 RepID=UPI002104AEAE|nr:zinc ABC transporter substrate-binding protein ZnuA [Enterovibrio paralichthyis]
MTRLINRLIIALLLTFPFYASAAPYLVTTIKPIGLIAKDIAGDNATVDVLLPDNASPHDYSLKPSDVKKLRQADRVFWVGPEMELFLSNTLENADNAVRLTDFPGMPVLSYDGNESDHDHHGHDHDHEGIDGHIWLGPEQAKVVARAVYENLVHLDPEHKDAYTENLNLFNGQVDDASTKIAQQLAQSPKGGYFLFHDAYGYFEKSFGLKPLGHLTVNPDRKPGAKTLVKIRNAIKDGQASCVFSEPQYNPAMVESLVNGTNANVVLLDPMAKNLTLKKNHYADFLNALGQSYTACFTK